MKKAMSLLFGLACVSLLFSCQNSGPFGDEITGVDLKNASNGVIITVEPTGTDDTENLLKAFADAAAAGPGTTIQLQEGDYYAGYMEIFDFQGSLVGAGREKTTVNLIPGRIPNIELNDVKNQADAWWRMIDGDIIISDMTFRVPDDLITEEISPLYGCMLTMLFLFNNYNADDHNTDNFQKVKISKTSFYGGKISPACSNYFGTDHNVMMGIWMGMDYWWPGPEEFTALTKGNYQIIDCYFENLVDPIEGFGLGETTRVKISSCTFNKNVATLFFFVNYGSNIYVCNNIFYNSGWYDLCVDDNDMGLVPGTLEIPQKRCNYFITGNTFNTTLPIPSLITNDHWVYLGPEARPAMQFFIANNVFNLADGSSGIVMNNSQDAVIRNNRFNGSCATGIAIDGFNLSDPEDVPFANNTLILGNNLSKLTSSTANIYLGEHSMNCTVVGSKTDGSVIDNGTDNRITGMHKGKPVLQLGPTIKDNLLLMRRMHK